jgi:hypothetical protein
LIKESITIEDAKTMFKPRLSSRSPLGNASTKTVRLAWRVAILIVLAATIFCGPLNRSPAETPPKAPVTQPTMNADEDDLVW